MNNQHACDECGREIPRTGVYSGSPKFCPACLLRRGLNLSEDLANDSSVDFDATQSFSPTADHARETSELEAGLQFGSHRIIRRLGRGGMGTVYEAEHQESGRRVALKILSHSLDDRQARNRFLREGRLAASVNHPNSVYVFGTEEVEGVPTISMELVGGGTLQDRVRKSGPLEQTEAVDAILQLIDGLEEAESKGVLHRDIKPANCFIDRKGVVKIGDFGLSISSSPRDDFTATEITQAGSFLGTPAFASPEQLRGDQLDTRSDIYSLGVTAYYLLTGDTPFSGKNMVQLLATVLDRPAPNVATKNPEVSPQLAAIVDKCLAKSQGNRPANYDALRVMLEPLSSKRPKTAPLGFRFLAGLLDYAISYLGASLVTVSLIGSIWSFESGGQPNWWATILFFGLVSLYYAVDEAIVGTTIGKRIFGLGLMQGKKRPSVGAVVTRALIYVLAPALPSLLLSPILAEPEGYYPATYVVLGFAGMGPYWVRAILFATARRSNGYGTVYDLLTGVSVVSRRLQDESARSLTTQIAVDEFDKGSSCQWVGPYQVLQDLSSVPTNAGGLQLAFDPKLLRRVWIKHTELNEPKVSDSERNLARQSRLRWLGGRRDTSEAWDCYEATDGCSLIGHLRKNLQWSRAESALASLAEELAQASKEESLPRTLSVDQIWITNEGSVKLLPFRCPDLEDISLDKKYALVEEQDFIDEGEKAKRFLQKATEYCVDQCRILRGRNDRTGVPVRALTLPATIQSSANIDECLRLLQPQDSVAKISWKQTKLLTAVTLALPILTAGSVLLLNSNYMQANSSKIRQLVMDLAYYKSFKQHPSPQLQEEAGLLSVYIAEQYREIKEDPDWQKPMARMMAKQGLFDELDPILEAPLASPDEAAKAREYYEQSALAQAQANVDKNLLTRLPYFAALAGLGTWLQFFWLPSLFTAIAFRGGLIVHGLGLEFVNNENLPASRARIFFRMLVPGLPVCGGLLIGLFFTAQGMGILTSAFFTLMCACLFAVVCFSLYRGRLVSDSIAGTYLVPR